ncbi:MAG TPA: hypothetical protein VFO36_13750, partial [Nitrospiraceae bacterium]|nr:hypothetical protein [Nitrospiraceae bacterium]
MGDLSKKRFILSAEATIVGADGLHTTKANAGPADERCHQLMTSAIMAVRALAIRRPIMVGVDRARCSALQADRRAIREVI